ncbi:MAG: phosphonate ABC transporter, permease protein PhnE [Coriobacteriia bacterium]|nr:phosphonate ABC transporter, permease protein PhnE [Coriobacteriia bacterium]MCL2750559.1 phosphonate ABC transporter, permease protein PhnE [Coriobacteriia bacterium]
MLDKLFKISPRAWRAWLSIQSRLNKGNSQPEKPQQKEKQTSIFTKRKRVFTLVFIVVATLYLVSSAAAEFNLIDGLESFPKAFIWITTYLVPDEKSLSNLPAILAKLSETVFVAIAVTVCAALCAFFFSLLGTTTTKTNPWLARMVRVVAAFFRNVPDVVWAMLLLFSFGQNVLTGFFALFFATFGLLTRTFIETIDEVSADCVEALNATGATTLQIVFQGIIPSVLSVIISWILYMIETNIRASTLIGILTATGIGYQFDMYYKMMNYASASLVVIAIVVVVIAIEITSTRIRKVIM